MAIGFGVGDILLLTKGLAITIRNIHDAPSELLGLAERIKSVDFIFSSLNRLPSNAVAGNIQNTQ